MALISATMGDGMKSLAEVAVLRTGHYKSGDFGEVVE